MDWHGEAKNVELAGSFDEWEGRLEMTRTSEYDDQRCATFTAKLKLPAGEYMYKLVVDDVWITGACARPVPQRQ